MKKITYMLLLLQGGFMMAQTKTVVTQNGEKVTISPYANNGLTANNGYMQLGGALTQPSVLTTTPAFTLALKGLQTGAATDNILVTDANGVIKTVSKANLSDNLGNHIATQNLDMSSKDIINISNGYVKNELRVQDRITTNTNYFGLYKNAGIFGIWNNSKNRNELSIDETTGKTTLTSAQIAKGTDGVAPVAGYVATAVDAAGNVVWKSPATTTGTGTLTGKNMIAVSNGASTAFKNTDISLAAGATDQVLQTINGVPTWVDPSSINNNVVIKTAKLVCMAKAGKANTTARKIYYDTKMVDPENALAGDVTNGSSYTIKKAGLHQIFLNLSTTTKNGGGSYWFYSIFKNGFDIAASDFGLDTVSGVVYLIDDFKVGDVLTFGITGSSYGYQAEYTRISVYRIE